MRATDETESCGIAESEAVTCAKFSAPSRPAPGITKFQLSPGLSALNPLSVTRGAAGRTGSSISDTELPPAHFAV